jgi:hypothetical protein
MKIHEIENEDARWYAERIVFYEKKLKSDQREGVTLNLKSIDAELKSDKRQLVLYGFYVKANEDGSYDVDTIGNK